MLKYLKKLKIFFQTFKLILMILGLIPLSLIIIFLYAYWSVPFEDIKKLKTEFVNVKVVDSLPQYSIVSKRPAHWAALSNISGHAVRAIVLSEDSSFYQHAGIDFVQLQEAVNEGLKGQKPWRGASTISQQMVKNLFLTNERSLWRKFREYFVTMAVEKHLEKKKILEIYLNIIEYGPGVYGIHQASYYYFKKHPGHLTPREGAFLAMLLPSPKRYSQSFRHRSLTRFAQKSIRQILGKMRAVGNISPEQYMENVSTPFFWEKAVATLPVEKNPNEEINDEDLQELEKMETEAPAQSTAVEAAPTENKSEEGTASQTPEASSTEIPQ